MWDVLQPIFLVLGGIGLFLYGMKMMSSGIEIIAGEKLHGFIQGATKNRFFAVIVRILATIAINSSTVTTIMTVSFVNSGLMTLAQSIGVIMGANVGTTFSAQLIALNFNAIAPLFIFIGIILHLFFKKKRVKNIGYILLGFGILFFGITVMGGPLRELSREPAFQTILTTFENPFLALLAGFIFTAIIQSSSATMGLLVTLHLYGDVPIPFETSAFIVLGTNIGTSITTVFASIPANRESKRAALFHIMYDIIGSMVFGTLIFVTMRFGGNQILGWFQNTFYTSAMQVAMFHTLYNFATMFLILPFVNQVANLMLKIVPSSAEEKDDALYEKRLIYLDTKISQSPSIAIRNAHLELCRLHKIANETLAVSLESFFERDFEKAKKTLKNEKVINHITRKITEKLVKINNRTLSNAEAQKIGSMFRVVYDIERIGDHAENIAEYSIAAVDNDLTFSEGALDELRSLSELTTLITSKSLSALETQTDTLIPDIKSLEEQTDVLAKHLAENHISRVIKEECEARCGLIFTDMIIDLERCADHANAIASSVAPGKKGNRKK